MKFRSIIVITLSLAILSCQKSHKLGYVDRSYVINNFKKKINIEERFEVKNKAFIKKRDSLIEDYQAQRKAASLRSKKMTPEQVQKLSLEFQQKEAFIGQ